MKLSEKIKHGILVDGTKFMIGELLIDVTQLEAREASARSIMEKFVFKVDTGRARSVETYAEMKQWMEDE